MTSIHAFPGAEPVPRCFKRFEHSVFRSAAFTACAFALLLIGVYALAMNLAAGRFYVRTPFGGYWSAGVGSWLLCLASLAAGGLSLMKGLGLRRHMLLVTDEGVSGRVTGSLGLHPENFTLTWSQLLDVKAGRTNVLKLVTADRTCRVCLADHLGAEILVRLMMELHRGDPTTAGRPWNSPL